MDQRIQSQIDSFTANLTRSYLARKRAEPPKVGRSPDGIAQVTVDGLGDIADITITAPEVPPRVAARIAAAVRAAWQAAARERATSEAAETSLATKPEYAELLEEEISTRYGVPEDTGRAEPPRSTDPDEDFDTSVMVSGRNHRR